MLRKSAFALATATLPFFLACPAQVDKPTVPPSGLAGKPGSAGAAAANPLGVQTPPPPPAGAQPPLGELPQFGGNPNPHAQAQAQANPHGAAPANPHAPAGAGTPSAPVVAPGHGQGAPGAAANAPIALAGVVTESIVASGYTYLKVKKSDGQEEWAAILKTEMKNGDQVKLAKQIQMFDFHSNTLNRTFSKILFANLVERKPADQAAP
jgi:hypothetical protein